MRILISLILCMLLPCTASAHTQQITPPADDLLRQAINIGRRIHAEVEVMEFACESQSIPAGMTDLFTQMAAMSAEIDLQGEEISIRLRMGDTHLADLGIAMSGEDVYFRSEALGTVVLRQDEVQNVAARLTGHILQNDEWNEGCGLVRERLESILTGAVSEARILLENGIGLTAGNEGKELCCLLLGTLRRAAECMLHDAFAEYIAGLEDAHSIAVTMNTEALAHDFSTAGEVLLIADGMYLRLAVHVNTCSPVAAIMAGNVIRPAELDDTAFEEWLNSLGTSSQQADGDSGEACQ